ncbi:hypothetical protein RHMOL_Rhmol13G0174700 [Rhododendron molle]|uniref:Uncharacterized protein n=1 Tax=Rhododendron molle TaxID=49168 RepID=A0ACC0L881_RHOML|nr:hypothetical protein RHMOL_Rhmol13G0174700 [Rhododendron molle]
MAKSLRSKREKRLKAIRREIVKPLYDKKDEAKLAAQEAALAAPKLPVRLHKSANSMDFIAPEAAATATATSSNNMGLLDEIAISPGVIEICNCHVSNPVYPDDNIMFCELSKRAFSASGHGWGLSGGPIITNGTGKSMRIRPIRASSAVTNLPSPPVASARLSQPPPEPNDSELEPADPDFYRIGYVQSVRAYGIEFKEGPDGFGVYASKDIEATRRARVIMEVPLELMLTISKEFPWMFFPDIIPIGHPIFDIINSTNPEEDLLELQDHKLASTMREQQRRALEFWQKNWNPWEVIQFSGNAKIHLDSFLSVFNISGLPGEYYHNSQLGSDAEGFIDGAVLAAARTLPTWSDGAVPPIPSAERKAVKELQEECRQRLTEFPTTADQDMHILDSMPEARRTLEAAIKYRLHRKSFIEKVIRALDIYRDRILF